MGSTPCSSKYFEARITVSNGTLPTNPAATLGQPGLIWGLDFAESGAEAVEICDSPHDGKFRWLHLNLADQSTQNWIARQGALPPTVRDLLLAQDTHQRTLVDGDVVGCVIHDFERDFDTVDNSRTGALRFALTETLMITTRLHPLRSADIMKQRFARGAGISGPAAALELLISSVAEVVAEISRASSVDVQKAEDDFLDGHHPPDPRKLIGIRRRLSQLHRLLDGMRAIFHRLEEDEELPERLRATVEKLYQRLQSLDGDIVAALGQLRLLRDEVDLQATQRTNQNLYILSIMTALVLPATLVTGIFGMNTGGIPWVDTPLGTAIATALAIGTAAATYVLLRLLGFMKN